MAEGREQSFLSPLEEQILQDADCEEDLDLQLLREREAATQRLWAGFQDSATAVAHLFRDCQQQAGLAAWVPFHESASAVTALYRGASDVCKQCMDSGARYGHRKRTKELVAWAKKKKKHIRRDELLAFLMDKPYQQQQQLIPPTSLGNQMSNDDVTEASPNSYQKLLPTPPGFIQGHQSPISSPRRRSLADSDLYTFSGKDGTGTGRKRTANSGSGTSFFDFNIIGPDSKRIRL